MVRLKIIKLFLVNFAIIAAFYFSLSGYVFSQTTEGAPDGGPGGNQSPTSGSQQPGVIQGESEPPWYYYWPDENLNPFGMSTLGNEGGGSTFGKSTERPSNLQVNPPMQEEMQNQENVDDVTNNVPPEDTLSPEESISVGSPSAPAKKGPVYKWVDDKGVIHVTNDLGSVPAEYLDKITINEQSNEQKQIE
jgi:hypothetical protein